MTDSMETLATAAHEVEGVSPDITSVADELARGQLGLVTGSGDDEQRHTDVTLRPLTGKDIIDAELAAERVVQTANGSELVRSPAMVEFELLRRQVAWLGNLNGPLSLLQLKSLSARYIERLIIAQRLGGSVLAGQLAADSGRLDAVSGKH
ncbi:phage tail assembly protein [Candidatus Pantoea persica]|uniref:phage tail assembly protein n=1 Tax=Candidatus Pantoea persica TaxID=2518128 RepID=UPI00215D8EFA|nr:phage tail assembly protein [Candidatus Pantoea persica]MBA2814928.1 Mu-like prophage FluMu protein gp41 [Candidatus Pantoea persica]